MSKKTMNEMMSDVIFAGFAQLSYLDWHKLDNNYKNLKLDTLLKPNSLAFNQIKTSDYKGNGKSNYSVDETIDGKKIYSATDARLFYLYSEHEEPNNNPKYPTLGNGNLFMGMTIIKY